MQRENRDVAVIQIVNAPPRYVQMRAREHVCERNWVAEQQRLINSLFPLRPKSQLISANLSEKLPLFATLTNFFLCFDSPLSLAHSSMLLSV